MNPEHPRILPDRDEYRRFYLDQKTTVTLSNGDTFVIPKGYRFDAHSVPWVLRWLFRSNGLDIYAALVHDALIDFEMLLRYNRKFQDGEYKYFMEKPEYFATEFRTKWMPIGVRMFGYLKYDLWGDNRGILKKNTKIIIKVTHDE